MGKVATSPVPSSGFPMLSKGTTIKMATSTICGQVATPTLPSEGSPTLSAGTEITNGYPTHMWARWTHHPAVLGVPNAQQGDNNQK